MARRSLTSKQQHVLEFLQQYFLEHGTSPLIREVQAGCQIHSYKSTLDRLNALERKGYIKRIPNKHYGIRVIKPFSIPSPARESPVTELQTAHPVASVGEAL